MTTFPEPSQETPVATAHIKNTNLGDIVTRGTELARDKLNKVFFVNFFRTRNLLNLGQTRFFSVREKIVSSNVRFGVAPDLRVKSLGIFRIVVW